VYFKYPYLDEQMLHISLGPPPLPFVNEIDDDVDALDIRDGQCPVFYFSVDHEATNGLDPGDIFEEVAGGYSMVIDGTTNLGLLHDTDVDAFEFAWIPDVNAFNVNVFGLLFSVDDNDPLTPEDESGGLNPAMIYASYLDGTNFEFLDTPLEDDVDAIAAWGTPLYAGYTSPVASCDSVNDLVIAVDTPNETVTLTFSAPQTATYTIYATTYPNAAAPPSPDWTSLVDIDLVAGEVTNFSITYAPLPDYLNYAVIAACP
jgi:hypothetical protein